MSGYAGYSKSNNAIAAESDHKAALTNLCRLYGLKKEAVIAHISACEWHHTSKFFNATDYYDARDCVRTRDLRLLSTKRPSDIQLYNRLIVKRELITECRRDWSTERIDYVIHSWSKVIDTAEKVKDEKKRAKLAKKQEVEIKAWEIELEKRRSDAAKSERATLARRCECMKIQQEVIRAALTGPVQIDPSCLASQIRKWFVHWDNIEEAVMCGLA